MIMCYQLVAMRFRCGSGVCDGNFLMHIEHSYLFSLQSAVIVLSYHMLKFINTTLVISRSMFYCLCCHAG